MAFNNLFVGFEARPFAELLATRIVAYKPPFSAQAVVADPLLPLPHDTLLAAFSRATRALCA